MLSFFQRHVLDEIWDLIGSVPEGFPTTYGMMVIEQFQENLDLISVTKILTKLNECWQSDDITQGEDDVVAEKGILFEKNASKTFGSTAPKHDLNSSTREKKLWFNSECRRIRNQYHYARKFYNRYKSHESRQFLKKNMSR